MQNYPSIAILALVLGACAVPSGPSDPQRAHLASSWNALVLQIAEEEDGFLTLKGVRTAAIMHIAMHDALNSVDPRYDAFSYTAANSQANATIAAAHAAYEVAVAMYPNFEPRLREELASWITSDAAESTLLGSETGSASAATILERRAGDSWDSEAEYTWHPMGPGVYAEFREHSDTPEGFVFGAGWAKARPFMLKQQDQFRSPPPPTIDSDAYTAAFHEVKEVGRAGSTTRTPDQTHLALWWKDFVESSHNRLARQLVQRENLDAWQATRMFALLNMAVFDAYVNVFDNKFHYNHWRPYTAIRWAENDDNPNTVADPNWNNTHGHTYAFPSYPSAHGCASAAAMTVLADTFGEQTHFEMFTPQVDRAGPGSEKIDMSPPHRSFDGFAEAALECSMSRVYLGIHFRYDSVEGNSLGTKIGRYGLERFLIAK